MKPDDEAIRPGPPPVPDIPDKVHLGDREWPLCPVCRVVPVTSAGLVCLECQKKLNIEKTSNQPDLGQLLFLYFWFFLMLLVAANFMLGWFGVAFFLLLVAVPVMLRILLAPSPTNKKHPNASKFIQFATDLAAVMGIAILALATTLIGFFITCTAIGQLEFPEGNQYLLCVAGGLIFGLSLFFWLLIKFWPKGDS